MKAVVREALTATMIRHVRNGLGAGACRIEGLGNIDYRLGRLYKGVGKWSCWTKTGRRIDVIETGPVFRAVYVVTETAAPDPKRPRTPIT